jgi:hypothetical protein
MNADHMVAIHNALHSPSRICRIGRDTLVVEIVDDPEKLFSRVLFGQFIVATQNLRKDSPNTKWVLESPETRQISWLHPANRNGFAGKITSHQDNNQLHIQVLRFYSNNKTHELINQTFELS